MMKAIIFDMDGVLTLTTSIQSEAESKVLSRVGISINPEALVNKYCGWKDIDVLKDILQRNNINADSEKLRKEKWNIVYKKLTQNGVSEIPGAKEIIEKLESHGYTLSVASATSAKFINIVLDKLGIKEKFAVIISGDDVKTGKPNPDIFLLTAKKLKIQPKECVVIEDAPTGVLAAKRAKMKCIAITTTHKREELKDADKIIDSFKELNIGDIQNL